MARQDRDKRIPRALLLRTESSSEEINTDYGQGGLRSISEKQGNNARRVQISAVLEQEFSNLKPEFVVEGSRVVINRSKRLPSEEIQI